MRPRTLVKTGTSDWNVVADAWPVPALAYGPGDATLDHAPDEHVRWDDYERGVSVIGAALTHLASAAAGRLSDPPYAPGRDAPGRYAPEREAPGGPSAGGDHREAIGGAATSPKARSSS